jgi:hypothetical protein
MEPPDVLGPSVIAGLCPCLLALLPELDGVVALLLEIAGILMAPPLLFLTVPASAILERNPCFEPGRCKEDEFTGEKGIERTEDDSPIPLAREPC